MKIALVADLHGNRPAVEALEKDLAHIAPDAVYCLGDIVGKGPSSDYTFDWAVRNCDLILGGNWDYGVGGRQFPKDHFYWAQLGEERMRRLCQLPLEHEMFFSGRRMRLFHGRPVMQELVRCESAAEEIIPFFSDGQGGTYDAVIYADAHRQAVRTMTPGMFINVGSVGNGLGEPRCCYAVMEGSMGPQNAPFELRLRQIDYDRGQAVADALATPDIPWIDAFVREVQTGRYSRSMIAGSAAK